MLMEHIEGIALLLTVLIVGAVFGRLHRNSKSEALEHLGDRVMFGLLALPLIALLAHAASPGTSVVWKLILPGPMAVYTVLLAGTDEESKGNFAKLSKHHFKKTLIISSFALYASAAFLAWRYRDLVFF